MSSSNPKSIHQKSIVQNTVVIAFFTGMLCMFLVDWAYNAATTNSAESSRHDEEQIRKRGVRYTSPLLECSDMQPLRVDLFSKLEKKLSTIIPESTDAQGVEMSVYLRDLNNGGWVEVGSEELYQPASLMKMPTLIAAFQKKDTSPDYFAQETEAALPYGINATQNIISGAPLALGEKTTIRDLVRRVVLYSDNMAHDTLVSKIGVIAMESVLDDFGIPPLTSAQEYRISPRMYARFLRILYNATYLSQQSSEDLLALLTHSTFDKGLRAGVPKSVIVASKFGERVMEEDGVKMYQLHDCGIVYASRPYILCIMTKGPAFEPLYDKIAQVSHIVYDVMQ